MGSCGRWDVRRLPTHPVYRLGDRCNNHPDGSALRILGYRKKTSEHWQKKKQQIKPRSSTRLSILRPKLVPPAHHSGSPHWSPILEVPYDTTLDLSH